MEDRSSSRRLSRESERRPRGFFAWIGDGAGLPEFDWIFPIRFGRSIRPQDTKKLRSASFPRRPCGAIQALSLEEAAPFEYIRPRNAG